ncbi:permease-like cell division protein FtsX [Nonomuraea sp. NPDC049695]|uniref:permease-like cell division protein FtsX n=1 Tax=Nonomuraea sp. NPDC049695 TaxID=3154734 RepID=UPI0034252724
MTSRVEDRLREALVEAGATVDTSALRPLREPQGRRFRADFRLVTAAAAVVVLAGAATAVWLVGSGDENRAVVAGPGPVESTEVAVFLCTKSRPKECQGRDVSREETEAVKRKLEELPQLEEMSFVGQEAAYKNFRAAFAHNKAVLDAVKVTDLPTSFRLKLKKGARTRVVEEALRGVPGVLGVMEQAPPEAESSKPLISAFLCSKGSEIPACAGKAATAAQKKAIEKMITAMPGVQEVVFEDRATAYEKFRRLYRDNKALIEATKVTDMPESFRVTMKPEAEWVPVVLKLRRQRGVSQALYAPCMTDSAMLSTAYGLLLSDREACPVGK